MVHLRSHPVWELLARLDDRQRIAISIAFYDARTYSEVAALLSLPEGTVKSQIRVGLRSLRSQLAEIGVNSSSNAFAPTPTGTVALSSAASFSTSEGLRVWT